MHPGCWNGLKQTAHCCLCGGSPAGLNVFKPHIIRNSRRSCLPATTPCRPAGLHDSQPRAPPLTPPMLSCLHDVSMDDVACLPEVVLEVLPGGGVAQVPNPHTPPDGDGPPAAAHADPAREGERDGCCMTAGFTSSTSTEVDSSAAGQGETDSFDLACKSARWPGV
mgnify:CR=1 FL=1